MRQSKIKKEKERKIKEVKNKIKFIIVLLMNTSISLY